MGMYTEFHLNVELSEKTPKDVIDVLQFMLGQRELGNTTIPSHPLFQHTRWKYMLHCDSASFPVIPSSMLETHQFFGTRLSIRTQLKNYNNEIEKFVDWIKPYLAHFQENFLGYYRYEEHEDPILIFREEEK